LLCLKNGDANAQQRNIFASAGSVKASGATSGVRVTGSGLIKRRAIAGALSRKSAGFVTPWKSASSVFHFVSITVSLVFQILFGVRCCCCCRLE